MQPKSDIPPTLPLPNQEAGRRTGLSAQGLFSCRAFVGFGPSLLDPSPEPVPLTRVQSARRSTLRQRVREHCPRVPGVYGMVDAHGDLLYVGKAKSLRARLLSYFRPKSRDPKAGRILAAARAVVWEEAPSEFAALLRELELIRRWRPRFNVQGQPLRRRRTFVCLGRRPAPYLFLSSRPAATVQAFFGPVPGGHSAREAVRRLNDLFRLRDCPQAQGMTFAGDGELFPVVRAAGCLRYEIGTCLGPCAAACSRSEYTHQVRAARAFLEGTDLSPLRALERDMTAAAAAQEFERAAALRDKLTVLQWLSDHLERLRQARDQHSFVYPLPGRGGREWWYLIHRGRVARVVPVPRDGAGQRAAAAALESVYRKKGAHAPEAVDAEVDTVLLVSAWFRRYPGERDRVLSPEQALAGCGNERSVAAD